MTSRSRLKRSSHRSGIILLVVLGMLAFISLLVVTYVAFSSSAVRTSRSLARAEFRSPDVPALFDDAMLKLVRGTDDPNDPFFGEDILSDFFGRDGSMNVSIMPPLSLRNGPTSAGAFMPARRPLHLGGGFVRIPIDFSVHFVPSENPRPAVTYLDDAFTGRIITFLAGPLENQSFRVLRSIGARATGAPYQNADGFLIQLDPQQYVTLGGGTEIQIQSLLASPNPHDVGVLFYHPGGNNEWGATGDDDSSGSPGNFAEAGYPVFSPNPSDDVPYGIHINPAPLNAAGFGVSFAGATQNWQSNVTVNGKNVPNVFFPNTFDGTNTINKSTAAGDYDEDYDAADFSNWFLAGRVRIPDGSGGFITRVIPSFHRPSVINYLINLADWSDSGTPQTALTEVYEAIRRSTMRPLPWGGGLSINREFTGGNGNFALATPIPYSSLSTNTNSRRIQIARLQLLVQALINGPRDVDNDGDGVPDSMWVDVGLPLITSPEGKLLRPLIAPMIEDTSGRLNLNAHGFHPHASQAIYWNNRAHHYSGNTQFTGQQLFRGLGYGPAEITFPVRFPFGTTGPAGAGVQGRALTTNNQLQNLLTARYRWSSNSEPTLSAPGDNSDDSLDRLRTVRPWDSDCLLGGLSVATGTPAGSGYGQSMDPMGYSGVAVDRFGHTVTTGSGRVFTVQNLTANPPQQQIDELRNDPYEFDPTGHLNGDAAFTLAEMEAVLRSANWDADLLPQRLRETIIESLREHPELANMLTTQSSSMDLPPAIPLDTARGSTPQSLVSVISSRLSLGLPPTPPPATPTGTETGVFDSTEIAAIATANAVYQQVIAPELMAGRKLDLNRAIGNGIDDNNNGVVDDPAEFGDFIDNDSDGWVDEVAEFRSAILRGHNGIDDDGDTLIDEFDERPAGANYTAFPFASSNDGTQNLFGNQPGEYAFLRTDSDVSGSGRELLARHLYVLVMALKGQGYNFPLFGTPETFARPEDYTPRKIAQWAVNVVDFRDPDSIMTRFAYDPDPLDGWTVTPTGPNVVWGCEAPELTFMESCAFHDVRVKDTDLESINAGGQTKEDATSPDDDTDSVRIPQGSLFLELYCNRHNPRIPGGLNELPLRRTLQGFPAELYTFTNALADSTSTDPNVNNGNVLDTAFLDLGRLAPVGPGQAVGAPVWRIAISSPHYNGAPNNLDAANPETLRQSHPNSYSFDPSNPFEVEPDANPITNNLTIDRYILFRDYRDPANPTNAGALTDVANAMSGPSAPAVRTSQIFFTPGVSSALIEPGRHVVFGPRTTTYLGSQLYDAAATPPTPTAPSGQRFVMDTAHGVSRYNVAGTEIIPNTDHFAPSQSFQVKTFGPAGWTGVFEDDMVGLNVSEPLPRSGNYYAQPDQYIDSTRAQFTGAGMFMDAYIDYSDNATTSARDQPEDIRVYTGAVYENPNTNTPIADLTVAKGADLTNNPDPFIGTVNEYCTAFLQRLADPLRPFDETFNPYITVDWITIDLTVFSGEDPRSELDPIGAGANSYATRSRHRSGRDKNGTVAQVLFSYETQGINTTAGAVTTGATNYFQFQGGMGDSGSFAATLGYLDETLFGQTLGHEAAIARDAGMLPATAPIFTSIDRGQPSDSYALHDWLNRPFASHHELMLVPATSPGRLFEEFTVPVAGSNYHPASGGVVDDARAAEFAGQHRHLLNFFQSSTTEGNTAQLSRVFDYVTTLPRYRGEVELVNPARLPTGANGSFPELQPARVSFVNTLQAPFNLLYDGRRQGQINLNTLSHFPVWQGLMQGHLTATELGQAEGSDSQLAFSRFQTARRGYASQATRNMVSGATVQSNATQPYNFGDLWLNGDVPTQFARPFRNAVDADIAPQIPGRGTATNSLSRNAYQGTLLRQDVNAGGVDQTNPFFVRPGTGAAHERRNRNAFMKYQTLMRMPNLVSKQSNVFTMRLTMGFFEVDSSTLSLGKEYNADIAQNKRHQMMYIIDRSKPVRFVPGEDTNVRDLVIYERMVE